MIWPRDARNCKGGGNVATRPGVLMRFREWRALAALDSERFVSVFMAVLDYAEFGIEPQALDEIGMMAFQIIRPKVDEDGEAYNKRVEDAKAAAAARWGNATACDRMPPDAEECGGMPDMPNTSPNTSPSPSPKTTTSTNSLSPSDGDFERPTLEMIEAEAKRAGLQVDATRFLADCESDGWRDSRGDPVRDWKKWLRGWAALSRANIQARGEKAKPAAHQYEQREYSADFYEDLQARQGEELARHTEGGTE